MRSPRKQRGGGSGGSPGRKSKSTTTMEITRNKNGAAESDDDGNDEPRHKKTIGRPPNPGRFIRESLVLIEPHPARGPGQGPGPGSHEWGDPPDGISSTRSDGPEDPGNLDYMPSSPLYIPVGEIGVLPTQFHPNSSDSHTLETPHVLPTTTIYTPNPGRGPGTHPVDPVETWEEMTVFSKWDLCDSLTFLVALRNNWPQSFMALDCASLLDLDLIELPVPKRFITPHKIIRCTHYVVIRFQFPRLSLSPDYARVYLFSNEDAPPGIPIIIGRGWMRSLFLAGMSERSHSQHVAFLDQATTYSLSGLSDLPPISSNMEYLNPYEGTIGGYNNGSYVGQPWSDIFSVQQ